jgi:hypothetical protein
MADKVHLLYPISFSRDFPETSHLHFACLGYKLCKFGRGRSKIKGTLYGGKNTFSSVPRFLFEGFSRTSQILHTWAIKDVSFVRIGLQ